MYINERMITSDTEGKKKKNKEYIEKNPKILEEAIKTLKDIEKIEKKIGKLKETSFVRSIIVNILVGGAKNSLHLYGKAVDGWFIQYPNPRKEQLEYIAKWIKENTDFNEILFYPKKLQWQ